MKKSIIVTGASGFTGRYVVQELSEHGYEVVATYCRNTVENEYSCHCQKIDLTDKHDCDELIKQFQPYAIIHLAAQNNVVLSQEIPGETIRINNTSVANLLETVKEYSPMTRCILAGSAAVYRKSDGRDKLMEDSPVDFNNAYTLSKIFQEQIARLYRDFGLEVICTRPFNYTGCYQETKTFVPSVCQQIYDISRNNGDRVLRLGNIDIYRDFSDVRDVARAYRLLLDERVHSGIYNISSGKAIRLRDIVEYLCSKTNMDFEIVTDSNLIRNGEAMYVCGDNSLLKGETGWDNKYTIFDTIDWMLDHISRNVRTI